MVQHSALGRSTETLKGLAGNEQATFNSDRNVIQVVVADGKEADVINSGAAGSNAMDRDHSLQKRDPLTASVGGATLVYLIASNIGNMETAVKVLWYLGLRKCFKKGKKLKNGGCLAPDGSFIIWRGEVLEFEHESVHVFAIGPKGCIQTITITGKRVFHNGDQIVQNTGRTDEQELKVKPEYQKREDKSLWYTNLPVGELMTEDEIKEFKELQVQVQQEREKAVTGIMAAAKKNVDGQTRKAMSFAKGSFNRTFSRSGSGSGRSPSSYESCQSSSQMGDNESSYESILKNLQEEPVGFDIPGSNVKEIAPPPPPSRFCSFSQKMPPKRSKRWTKVATAVNWLRVLSKTRKARELQRVSRGGSASVTPKGISFRQGAEPAVNRSSRSLSSRPGFQDSGLPGIFDSNSHSTRNGDNQGGRPKTAQPKMFGPNPHTVVDNPHASEEAKGEKQ